MNKDNLKGSVDQALEHSQISGTLPDEGIQGGSASAEHESNHDSHPAEPIVLPPASTMCLCEHALTKTPTSTKFYTCIAWGSIQLHITEYSGFINDVRLTSVDGTLLFKSKKQSVREALAFLAPEDMVTAQRMVTALRYQAKAQAEAGN